MLLDLIAPQKPKAARVVRGGSLAAPSDWLLKLLGANTTAAGLEVNEDLATNLSSVYCAVNLLSNAMALPIAVYERLDNGGKELAKNHEVNILLRRRANRGMSAKRFRKYLQACKLLWGNGYAEIERDRRGRAISLTPIHPRRVKPTVDEATGEVLYSIDGGKTTLDRRSMFHIMGYSRDGISGISVIAAARESVGLGLATENYGAQFFGNGAEPLGYLKRPAEAAELDEEGEQELRESWQRNHGRDRRHSVAILHEGTEWVDVGMPNEDAQFLETRKFQVTEIARWFGVPPHMIADLERATFSNIEQLSIHFVVYSLGPHLDDFQDETSFSLINENDAETYFAEFNLKGILSGDHAARATFYKTLWEMGTISINEIRSLENMNPIGPAGDKYFMQTSYTTIERAAAGITTGPGNPSPAPSKAEEQPPHRRRSKKAMESKPIEQPATTTTSNSDAIQVSLMPVFVAAAERIVKKETNALTRAAAKHAGDRPAFESWARRFFVEQAEQCASEFLPAVDTLARLASIDQAAVHTRLTRFSQLHQEKDLSYSLAAFDQGNVADVCSLRLKEEPARMAVEVMAAVQAD